MKSSVKGYLLGIAAAASYGMNPLFALPLYADGMQVESVLFWRYILALPAVLLLLLWRGRSVMVAPRQLSPVLAMGFLMAASSLLLFLSYKYMDVGIASTLLFMYPLFVALIMAVRYGERLSAMTVLCMFGALAGVAMLSSPSGQGVVTWTGIVLVVLSSLSYAIYLVGVNREPLRRIATLTMTFWVLVAGTLMFSAICLYEGRLQVPQSPLAWTNALALALLPTVLSLLCTNAAIEIIGSTRVAILGAFEPVTAVFIGVTVFNEVLGFNEILGFIIIIVSVTMIVSAPRIPGHVLSVRRMFPSLRRRGK